ncbi:MAG TPA: rhodanese-like domain-containing protein [Gallionella sp.]|nr:rhodanese-like domain-containing protein [Gallionella sp.]
MNNLKKLIAFFALALSTSSAFAADAAAPKADEQPWIYKTQRLDRAQLDRLLGHPEKLLFIDVRRPDEVSKIGGFPVYLSVQAKNIEESLDYIPKNRTIVTVSNRAHRAGAAADFLSAHGYKVAGAVGTKDYEEQGGTIFRIAVPAPKADAQAAAPAPAAAK